MQKNRPALEHYGTHFISGAAEPRTRQPKADDARIRGDLPAIDWYTIRKGSIQNRPPKTARANPVHSAVGCDIMRQTETTMRTFGVNMDYGKWGYNGK